MGDTDYSKLNKDVEKVISKVDKDELVKLALDLCNIDSPVGYEKDVLEFIYSWFEKEGFTPKKVGMLEDRYNIVGKLKGKGNGYSLLFNAHTDTPLSKEDTWIQADAADPVWHSAWLEGDKLVGYSTVNDKGPLAATMIAAKAIKESGVHLEGDLLVTAVCNEISRNPVDEFQPPCYASREIGTQYMVAHGVLADYALVAEATGHGYTWLECGAAAFKLTIALEGTYAYIPFLKRPTTIEASPNAIVRMARVIEAFEDWAYEFQQKYQFKFSGGTVIPKASIVGVRGGDPTSCGSVIGVCSLYVKCFIPPRFNPLTISRELKEVTDKIGVPVEIEPYTYRPGIEGENISELTNAIKKAHLAVFNEKTKQIIPEFTSMWRDCNLFNHFGIPSVTYGPGGGAAGTLAKGQKISMEVNELYQFAKSYVLIALDICNKKKE
jgi:acetylornithine deacetylase/succinyl-diaminopimelate desuccinylase-like protein